MEINEVFKKYPENEPNDYGTNYMTLLDIKGNICYAIRYFNEDGEFEENHGKVLAFADMQPSSILNSLTTNKITVDSFHNQSLKQFIKGLFNDSNQKYSLDKIKEIANEKFYFDYSDFTDYPFPTCFVYEILFDLVFDLDSKPFLHLTFEQKDIVIGDKVQQTIIKVYERNTIT